MRVLIGLLLAVAVAGAAVGIGTHLYNLGVAQGIAQSGKLPTPGPGAGPYPAYPYPYPYYPYGGPFHAFGFGFFGLLWVILLAFLFFGLARRAYWGWGGGRHWGPGSGRGGPRWLEEWHRHAHEPKESSGTV